jgi:cystathionine beta-lyase
MTHRDDLAQTLKLSHMRMGQMVGANDAEMVLRSLSTMRMRYLAQDSSARAVSQWLSTRAEIAQVLHPALPQSPGHAHWKALTCHPSSSPTGWAAGLLSVMIDARFTSQQVDAFCDGLNIFKLGYSWGGPMSLVVPYRLQTIRSQEQTHLQKGHLVRFAMGLEDADDLINDLQQSIEKNLKV